jgi:hypothetical protein
MKNFFTSMAAIALMLLGSQAQALTIDPTYTPQWTSVAGPDQNSIIADFETQIGSSLGTEYIKQDDSGESGSFAGSYTITTDFDSSGTITYDGGGGISCPQCYLMVKDGNAIPQAYLFDLGSWDGEETITLENFWVDPTCTQNCGAISNISLWGTPGQVPVPAPLALLAIGLAGITLRRMKKQA